MKQFTLVVFLFVTSLLPAQIIPFEPLSFEETEFENVGTRIVFEDRNGFLWIEEFDRGLIRYDGKNIEKFFETVALPTRINDLYQDEYGYLWVLGMGENAQLPCLNVSHRPIAADLISDTLYFNNEHLSIPLLGVQEVKVNAGFSISADHKILVCTDSLLVQYYYANETTLVADTIHAVKANDTDGTLRSAIYLPDGSIVFTMVAGKYQVVKFKGHERIATDTFYVDDVYQLSFFLTDDRGGIWASFAENNLCYLPNPTQPNKEEFLLLPFEIPINDIESFDDENLLVATKGNGVYEVDREAFKVIKQYSTNEGLEHPGVFSMKAGKEKIWLGTTTGPVGLPKNYKAFTAFNTDYDIAGQAFLPIDAVNATGAQIKLKGDQRAYSAACTGNGLVLFTPSGEWQQLDAANALNSSAIVGVTSNEKDRIWVTPVSGGVNCIFPKGEGLPSFKEVQELDLFGNAYEASHVKGYGLFLPDLCKMPANDPAIPTEEVLYGANNYMIQILVDNEQWLFIEKKSGFLTNNGICVTDQDEAGYLYFGNNLGLMRTAQPFTREYYQQIKASGRVNRKNKATYTTEKIIDSIPLTWGDTVFEEVNALLIHEGEIWVAVETGVLILAAADLTATAFIPALSTKSGVPLIPQSFQYSDGSIWGGTSLGGILAYDVKSRSVERLVQSGDGLLDDQIFGPKDLSIDAQGVINYGTANGLVRYDPKLDPQDTAALAIAIREYAFFDNGRGKNELNLSYIGLSYAATKSMSYKTRLVGYDDAWSEPTDKTEVRYTNLSAFLFPKTYEFEVMASDYRGGWHSLKTAFPVTVSPPIWSRWWAFLLYGLLAVFVGRKYLSWRLEEQKKTIALEEAKTIKAQKEVIEKKNEENEILLKEIHHRVKNNLQVISSLLSFQSRAINDKFVKTALLDSQSRVRSMSLIHQKLYWGQHLAAVEMKNYLGNLAESLIDAYSDEEVVTVALEMDTIELDVDYAIPLGLMANELVTNSLKYAFPDERKGHIKIGLAQQEDDLILRVADDGIGASSSKKQSADDGGFGSELIDMLSLQLQGVLQQSSSGGFQTQFRFPYPSR